MGDLYLFFLLYIYNHDRIDLINDLGAEFDMRINTSKSKIIVHEEMEIMFDPDKIRLENDEMEEVEFFKYLGKLYKGKNGIRENKLRR